MSVKAMQARLRDYAGPYANEHVCLDAADMLGELLEENERLRVALDQIVRIMSIEDLAESRISMAHDIARAALEPRK
jgi:hypothetical protein